MGNRAVITWAPDENIGDSLGVYLHWNGGEDSVRGFLLYCKMRDFRPPDQDCYGYSHFCQVVCNFFGGGLDCGIDLCKNLDCDNWDNGTYLCKGWEIRGHMYQEPNKDGHRMLDLLKIIDTSQPSSEQLGREKIEELYQAMQEKEVLEKQDDQTAKTLESFFF